MYDRARIQNFRAIEDARVEELARVNVVVGGAGTGKTALLEALFVHSGAANPELLERTFPQRGVTRESASVDGAIRLYEGFFRQRSGAREIAIEAPWRALARTTRIERASAGNVEVLGAQGRRSIQATYALRATLDEPGSSRTSVLHLLPDSAYLVSPPPPEPAFPSLLMGATVRPTSEEFAKLWSAAEASGGTEALSAVLARLAGKPIRGRIAVDQATRPYLALTRDGGTESAHPAEFGMGFARTLVTLLHVATTRGGVVFLDEFDSAVHAAVLPDLAAALLDAAATHDVQVFLTTHRLETVDALLEAAGDRPELLRVLQARHDGGGVVYETWSHAEALGARQTQDFDLRMSR